MWTTILKKPMWDIDISPDTRVISTNVEYEIGSTIDIKPTVQNGDMYGNNKPNGLWYSLGDSWNTFVKEVLDDRDRKYVYEIEVVGNILKLTTEQEHRDFSLKYRNQEALADYELHKKYLKSLKVGNGEEYFEVYMEDKNHKEDMFNNWKMTEERWEKYMDRQIKNVENVLFKLKYKALEIEWDRVAQDYDGIEALGGDLRRHTYIDKHGEYGDLFWLAMWDVNSGVVWNNHTVMIVKKLYENKDFKKQLRKAPLYVGADFEQPKNSEGDDFVWLTKFNENEWNVKFISKDGQVRATLVFSSDEYTDEYIWLLDLFVVNAPLRGQGLGENGVLELIDTIRMKEPVILRKLLDVVKSKSQYGHENTTLIKNLERAIEEDEPLPIKLGEIDPDAEGFWNKMIQRHGSETGLQKMWESILKRDNFKVGQGLEDADFWLYSKGSKILNTEEIDAKFMYYWMLNIYNQGYWKQIGRGSVQQFITVKDVRDLMRRVTTQ